MKLLALRYLRGTAPVHTAAHICSMTVKLLSGSQSASPISGPQQPVASFCCTERTVCTPPLSALPTHLHHTLFSLGRQTQQEAGSAKLVLMVNLRLDKGFAFFTAISTFHLCVRLLAGRTLCIMRKTEAAHPLSISRGHFKIDFGPFSSLY